MSLIAIAVVLLLIVDWSQTRFIAKNPDKFFETNLILGKHPSVQAVNVYFAGCILLVVMGYAALPDAITLAISVGLLLLEAFITIRNYRRGIRMA